MIPRNLTFLYLALLLLRPQVDASQTVQGGLYRPGVTPPRILWVIDPVYTDAARQAKVQGMVILSVVVRKDGSVGDIKVLHSLGQGLDENAVEAVRKWGFRSGLRDGKPADISVVIELDFRLPTPVK
jgi:protein TonB